MKKYIVLLVVNVAVFSLLQFSVIIVIVLLGLASSDAHLQGAMGGLRHFCLIHVNYIYCNSLFQKIIIW